MIAHAHFPFACLATTLMIAIPALAEVHFELNFGHTANDYYATLELSDTNAVTYHRVESPSGLIWKQTDGSGSSAGDTWTSDFGSLLDECTNGLWSLTLNVGDASETNYAFTVTAADLTTNTFGEVIILYPTYGSTVTTNQPTVLWSGPAYLPELYVNVANSDYSFYEYIRPDSSETNWTVPSPMPGGDYSALVNYEDWDFQDMTASAPTNAVGPLSGWTPKFGIASYDYNAFSVSSPSPPPASSLGTALEAYYLPWTPGGDTIWFAQTNETWDGTDAAQSGAVALNGSSWIETTVTNSGYLQCWIKIAADAGDYVEVTVNGNYEYDWRESSDWEPYEIYLSAGDTVRWTLYNDDDTGSGQDAAFLDRVEFGDDYLALAVDAPRFQWTTGGDGDRDWFEQWDETYQGNDIDAAQSGAGYDIGLYRESWIETTIEGPGTLSFAWGSLADPGDSLEFSTNGIYVDELPGDGGWDTYGLALPSGSNTLRWTFHNDDDSETGLYDAAFLDRVDFTPAAPSTTVQYEADLKLEIGRVLLGTGEYYRVHSYFSSYAPTNGGIHVESFTGEIGGGEYWTYDPHFDTLQEAIDACEAGPWSIWFNRYEPDEKVFTFTVSMPALTTNDIPPVSISSPLHGATGVSSTPDYTWSGPAYYSHINVDIYDAENSLFIDSDHFLPPTQTAWTNAATAPNGTNRFTVSYVWDAYSGITISEPVDSGGQPMQTWIATYALRSDDRHSYLVGGGLTPLPVTIVPTAVTNGEFDLWFLSQSDALHYVEWSSNLVTGPWMSLTNLTGNGSSNALPIQVTNNQTFFRILTE